jgi:DNA-binding transcriptional MerR regulator
MNTQLERPRWISIGKAARKIGVSHRACYGYAIRGLIGPVIRTPGGHLRVQEQHLEAMLADELLQPTGTSR